MGPELLTTEGREHAEHPALSRERKCDSLLWDLTFPVHGLNRQPEVAALQLTSRGAPNTVLSARINQGLHQHFCGSSDPHQEVFLNWKAVLPTSSPIHPIERKMPYRMVEEAARGCEFHLFTRNRSDRVIIFLQVIHVLKRKQEKLRWPAVPRRTFGARTARPVELVAGGRRGHRGDWPGSHTLTGRLSTHKRPTKALQPPGPQELPFQKRASPRNTLKQVFIILV